MMKSIFAISILSCASAMAQPVAVMEYDYHKVRSEDSDSHYVALGMVFPTKVGSFDAYWQGVNSQGNGWKDSLSGWETGYSYRIEGDGYAITPRIAVGQMSNINFGVSSHTSMYCLISTEVSRQLTDSVGGFISVSHMNGMNQWSIPASNRVIAGVDISLDSSYYLRVGYSNIRQFKTSQDGIQVAVSKSF